MFKHSVIALSAATMLAATALAPTGALAHFRAASGLSGRPVVQSGTLTGLSGGSPITLKPPAGGGVGLGGSTGGTKPPIHPICPSAVCRFHPILGGGGTTGSGGGTTGSGGGTTGSGAGTTTSKPSPAHGGSGFAIGVGDSVGSTTSDCDVVRKRTPSGKIVEICNNWIAE